MELTNSFDILLRTFSPVFTEPSFQTFRLLMTGWILSVRHRYVTDLIVSSDSTANGHFTDYHRFFSKAVWDIDHLWKLLAQLIVAQLIGPDGVIFLAGDDTLCRADAVYNYEDPALRQREPLLRSGIDQHQQHPRHVEPRDGTEVEAHSANEREERRMRKSFSVQPPEKQALHRVDQRYQKQPKKDHAERTTGTHVFHPEIAGAAKMRIAASRINAHLATHNIVWLDIFESSNDPLAHHIDPWPLRMHLVHWPGHRAMVIVHEHHTEHRHLPSADQSWGGNG